jgi:phosphoribosylanthranilate isomerase
MIVQIYEVATPAEALTLAALGVDHIGILVGDGEFPREQDLRSAAAIRAAVAPPSKVCALFLTAQVARIIACARTLAPDIVHLGAALERFGPAACREVKQALGGTRIMRSIPVTGADAHAHAAAHVGIADVLLLDSHGQGEAQIGAQGVTHDWSVSAGIVRTVPLPVILAGGLGADNVAAAIAAVRPAGVDSKTKTDVPGTHRKDAARVAAFLRAAKGAGAPAERRPEAGTPATGAPPGTRVRQGGPRPR